jgi:hypothetical protein
MILTEFVLLEVQEFLGRSKSDVNNLVNVSRKFQEIKRSNYYWKLNKDQSSEYHNDVTFKSRLDSLLSNASMQSSLNLNDFNTISDVSALGNVHTLDISDY